MILTEQQIVSNTNWLLKNGSPPVKYLTYKYLTKTPSQSDEMKTLWQDVERCTEITQIFDKQRIDGSWCSGGSWALSPSYSPQNGADPYNPKYVTTVWVLPLLGEIGFTTQDSRIKKSCDFTLEQGYFKHPIFKDPSIPVFSADISPCRFSQYLVALSSVNCKYDIRVEKGYEYLLSQQQEDGGWVLPKHLAERNWNRSCPWSTYHAATALYYRDDKECEEAITRALTFLVRHLSVKEPEDICKFYYHGHNTVRELLMLSEYKIGLKDSAVQLLINWLMSMYQEDEGYFRYNGKPISKYTQKLDGMDTRVAKYRLYHVIENEWLTLHMTRICMNMLT